MSCETGEIVVFDSGLGGLSVLRQLRQLMPQEDYLYFGDSANAPYGTRTTQQVRQLTISRISELVTPQTKAIVIACNTATSAAITDLRQIYAERIVIGVEPALKLAAEQFPGGRILVMATEVTLREEKFSHLMERFSPAHEIIKVPCPGLVELIEQGECSGVRMQQLLQRCLDPYLDKPVDAVVLGCTHYPFARAAIAQVVGKDVCICDGALGTARETRRRLQLAGLCKTSGQGSVEIQNSLQDPQMLQRAWQLLEMKA